MPLARTGLLVGLFVGLIAITLQNQSPALSVVFLGMRSQPLPLGIWIIGAIIWGILVGLTLLFILNLNNQIPQSPPRPRTARQEGNHRPAQSTDWETSANNDWGNSDSDWESQPTRSQKTTVASGPVTDESRSIDEQRYARAGETAPPSTYSRSASDPDFFGQSGQRESVFDAEYRMVNPPGQEPSQNREWDEFEDDFFEQD